MIRTSARSSSDNKGLVRRTVERPRESKLKGWKLGAVGEKESVSGVLVRDLVLVRH